jgi:hypothetical protein
LLTSTVILSPNVPSSQGVEPRYLEGKKLLICPMSGLKSLSIQFLAYRYFDSYAPTVSLQVPCSLERAGTTRPLFSPPLRSLEVSLNLAQPIQPLVLFGSNLQPRPQSTLLQPLSFPLLFSASSLSSRELPLFFICYFLPSRDAVLSLLQPLRRVSPKCASLSLFALLFFSLLLQAVSSLSIFFWGPTRPLVTLVPILCYNTQLLSEDTEL